MNAFKRIQLSIEILKHDGLKALSTAFLSKIGAIDTVNINGWYIPVQKREYIFFMNAWEPGVKRFLTEIKPATLITAGAYPGDYLAYAWDLDVKIIYGFEPDKERFSYIYKFINYNKDKFDNIYKKDNSNIKYIIASKKHKYLTVYNLALWSQNTIIKLNDPSIEARAIALKYLNLEIKHPCIVILDLEGHEIEALKGAENLWDKCKFIIEVLYKNKDKYAEWLLKNNFSYFTIDRVHNDTEYWIVTQ